MKASSFWHLLGCVFCDNFVGYLVSRCSLASETEFCFRKMHQETLCFFVSYLRHALLCHDWDHDPSWCNPQKNETRGIKRPNLHSKVTTEETGWWWSVPFGCGEGSWMWHIDSTSTLQSGFNTRSPALCDRICTIFKENSQFPRQGDYIDAKLGLAMGLSTMAAAAWGNTFRRWSLICRTQYVIMVNLLATMSHNQLPPKR